MQHRGAPDPNRDTPEGNDPYGPALPRYRWEDDLDQELDKREHRTIEEEAA